LLRNHKKQIKNSLKYPPGLELHADPLLYSLVLCHSYDFAYRNKVLLETILARKVIPLKIPEISSIY
jgi:hypothetical protein